MSEFIPLSAVAFQEIKAKLSVLQLDSRILSEKGKEFLNLDGILLTNQKDHDIRCYMVYQNSIIHRPMPSEPTEPGGEK